MRILLFFVFLTVALSSNLYIVHVNPLQKLWNLLEFFPPNIQVVVGDSICFVCSGDPGTVTFTPDPNTVPPVMDLAALAYGAGFFPIGGPMVSNASALYSSGGLVIGTNYTFTFVTPGTFTYYSILTAPHFYGGAVHVLPVGSSVPLSPQEVEAQAQQSIREAFAPFFAIDVPSLLAPPKPFRSGTMYNVLIGYSSFANNRPAYWMGFEPENITLYEGDSVNFSLASRDVPHPVGFNESNIFIIDPIYDPVNQKLRINTNFLLPYGDITAYQGGFLVLGIFAPPDFAMGPLPTTTEGHVTFIKAGHYPYLCSFHDELGMLGWVKVLPSQATPTPIEEWAPYPPPPVPQTVIFPLDDNSNEGVKSLVKLGWLAVLLASWLSL
eukprot:TRINITY_DN1541_c0_g1_i2.p1 TRINITY_DN1541_c0_g1~~TRINITY_DN1541_c0_g1_i2.p1  ORF type:complete len:381 (-),score=33.82 TRINITY_DN1541_c0_g1_i2:50-1192(-)